MSETNNAMTVVATSNNKNSKPKLKLGLPILGAFIVICLICGSVFLHQWGFAEKFNGWLEDHNQQQSAPAPLTDVTTTPDLIGEQVAYGGEFDGYRLMNGSNMTFSRGRAILFEGGQKQLNGLIEKLKQLDEDYELIVFGHSDIVGKYLANMALSKERAEVVKEYLVKNGITATIHVQGLGDVHARYSADDPKREEDRRTEIAIFVQ